MLFKITQLSLLLPSFITLAFHSLARWSLERDVETGSSLRFGGKGLLFKTCIAATLYGNAPLFPCPAPCLGVSYCSWIARLAVLGETVVTHSCVNLNPLAQQSQFNPKRQNVRLCCFRIIMSFINILIKTSSSLILSSLLF